MSTQHAINAVQQQQGDDRTDDKYTITAQHPDLSTSWAGSDGNGSDDDFLTVTRTRRQLRAAMASGAQKLLESFYGKSAVAAINRTDSVDADDYEEDR
jgi:hypothetical protein